MKSCSSFRTFLTTSPGWPTRLPDWEKTRRRVAVISKAIETNPKPNDLGSFWLYLERGDMYTARQMYASALADYDKGIELVPFRSHIYKRRAKAHFYLKNYEKALADIAKAVELLPSNGSNLWCIPPAQVARCPDEHLRKGLLELADKAIEKTKGAAGAYAVRRNPSTRIRESGGGTRRFSQSR